MTLVPYIRQSRSKERSISVEEQRRDIQRWASANGVEQERALDDVITRCASGEIGGVEYRPVIDRTYALDEIVEATRYIETGQKPGNVVLCVSEAAPGAQPERATKQEDEVPA